MILRDHANQLTKNHIVFVADNGIEYFSNLNGDDKIHVFHRNFMNVYLEQFQETLGLTIRYDDIVSISTLENHDEVIHDLPNRLCGLFVMSAKCRQLTLSDPVKQHIRQIRIDRANLETVPNIFGCAQLEVFCINRCNIRTLDALDYQLPPSLKEFNLSHNSLQSLTDNVLVQEVLTELASRRPKPRIVLSDNHIANLFALPRELAQQINLLRQGTYVFHPIRNHNVAAVNIQNIVHEGGGELAAGILNTGQTVHLSSVNQSIVQSFEVIRQYLAKHRLTVPKLEFVKHSSWFGFGDVPQNYENTLFTEFLAAYSHLSNSLQTDFNLPTKHTVTQLTFRNTFETIWTVVCHCIQSERTSKADIFERMAAELTDSIHVCFTGKYNRLFNVLVGMVEGVQVGISRQEETQMEISRILAKYNAQPSNRDTFTTAWCEARHVLDGTPNAQDWMDALMDLAPEPEMFRAEYWRTWDNLILTLREKDVVGALDEHGEIHWIQDV